MSSAWSAASRCRGGGALFLLLLVCQSLREAEPLDGSISSRGCPLPNFPEDGSYRISKYDKKIVPGDIAKPYTILTYSCNEGYDPTKSVSVCRNDNNTWTASPQCFKRCDMLTPESVLFECFSPKDTSTHCLRKLRHGSIIRPAFKDQHSSMERELGTLQCTNGRWEMVIPASDGAGESDSCSSTASHEQIPAKDSATLIEQFEKLERLQKELSDCKESIRLVNREGANEESGKESSELKKTLRILSQESERLREQIKSLKSDLEKATSEKSEQWSTVSALTQTVAELTTFKRIFHNVSRLTSSIVLSSPHYIRGLPWKLGVKKFTSGGSTYLAVYLYSNEESQLDWSCRAKSELWLISNQPEMKPFYKIDDQYYEYSRDMSSWGWNQFLTWTDLMDPIKGYVKNDSILLEIQISAEAPQGDIEQETAISKVKRMIAELTTFKRTFHNISRLTTSTIYSSPHYLRGIPWKIAIRLSDPEVGAPQYLGVYLYSNEESTASWSCEAKSEVQLLSNKPEIKPFSKIDDKYYKYSQEQTSWGWSKFMAWTEVLDPQNGYVTDDSITLEIQISAEAPQGDVEMVTQLAALQQRIAELTTFKRTFPNIDQLTDWVRSPPHSLYGLTWKIAIKSFQPDNDGLKYLGVYLNCTEASLSDSLTKTVSFKLRLLSFKPGVDPISFKESAHNFTRNENPWGWTKFIEWKKLMDPDNGYVKDNSIMVEAQI